MCACGDVGMVKKRTHVTLQHGLPTITLTAEAVCQETGKVRFLMRQEATLKARHVGHCVVQRFVPDLRLGTT
eukprot:1374511-Amphidinium_carterae.1